MGLMGLVAGGCATRTETTTGLPYRPRTPQKYDSVVRTPSDGTAAADAATKGPAFAPRHPVAQVPTVPYDRLTTTDWRLAAGTWLGTPYRTGGITRSGADCSGFALSLHREVTGIELPRTTGLQWERGREIPVKLVRPGDLLFFQTLRGQDAISHVGVVMDSQEFAHASSSLGVTFAPFDHGYWQQRLVGARRFEP